MWQKNSFSSDFIPWTLSTVSLHGKISINFTPSGTLKRSRPGALKINRCSGPDFPSSWRCPLLLLGSFLNFFASHLLLLYYMFLCVYSPALKRALGSPGFFFLNFWWGGLKIFSPRGPRRGRSRMGRGDLRKKSDWSQNCPLNAKLHVGHFLLF